MSRRERRSAGRLPDQAQAEAWLRSTLDEARRGTLPGMVLTEATFADAAAEYLLYLTDDRGRKASIVQDYRSIIPVHLWPAFGEQPLESIGVAAVEAFQAQLARREHRGPPITARTRNKILNVLHGIFKRAKKVWSLPVNPAAELERHPDRNSGDIEVYAPEEVWALVRAAPACATPRSMPPRRSPACAWVSCVRCAGATSTSPARSSALAPATRRGS